MNDKLYILTITAVLAPACGLLALGVGVAGGLSAGESLPDALNATTGGVVGSIIGLWIIGRFPRHRI